MVIIYDEDPDDKDDLIGRSWINFKLEKKTYKG